MSEHKTIAKGAFWSLFSQFGIKLIGFILIVILARFVDQNQVGLYYHVLSVMGIIYVLTDLGLIYSNSRYVPYLYGKGEMKKLKWLIKWTYVLGGALTFIVSFLVFIFSKELAYFLNQPLLEVPLKVFSFWLFFQELLDISKGVLNGRRQFRETQMLDLLANILKLIFSVVLIYFGYINSEHLSLAYTISFALVSIISLYYVHKIYSKIKTKDDEATFDKTELGKEILTFGITVTLIYLLGVTMDYTDRILLGFFLGSDSALAIAVYSVASGVANLLMIVPVAIGTVFFPLAAEFNLEKKEKLKEITDISYKWITVGTAPMLLILVLFSSELLGLLYGSAYQPGFLALVFLSIGLFFRGITLPFANALGALRKLNIEFKITLVSAFANIVLNVILISASLNGSITVIGPTGAASLASALALILSAVLFVHYYGALTKIKIQWHARKVIYAILFSLILIIIMKLTFGKFLDYFFLFKLEETSVKEIVLNKIFKLVILGALFLLSYILYLLIIARSKIFDKRDIEVLTSVLQRLSIPSKVREVILRNFEV